MAKYVITSAQAYASPHTHFWEGLLAYAKRIKAEVIVLPMIGNCAAQDWDKIHKIFVPYLEYGRKHLNSNIAIEQFNVRPYQIDPLTGLDRFAQQGTTIIFASPKQRLKPVPHSNFKYPKFLVTTGAVTRPNYATSDDVSAERRRLGDIARRDHCYGFIVVEVVNNKLFHMRQVRANSEGVFVDLGVKYDGKVRTSVQAEAMILGDFHCGQADPIVVQATYEMIREFKPKRLILHDFFDGHSISHWIEKKPVRERLIQVYDKGLFTLEGELKDAYDQLKVFSEMCEEVVVVFSNHHAFLHRYLEEFRFAKDAPQNLRIAIDLIQWMAEKDYNDPVEAGIKKFGDLPNVKFLREDEDYKIHGYQLGAHGDKSMSMGYGSMTTKENAWGKSCSGHVHKAQVLRQTYTVGTCLPLNMFYMRGYPSDWTHSHAFLWETGTVQLVHIFGKFYRLR